MYNIIHSLHYICECSCVSVLISRNISLPFPTTIPSSLPPPPSHLCLFSIYTPPPTTPSILSLHPCLYLKIPKIKDEALNYEMNCLLGFRKWIKFLDSPKTRSKRPLDKDHATCETNWRTQRQTGRVKDRKKDGQKLTDWTLTIKDIFLCNKIFLTLANIIKYWSQMKEGSKRKNIVIIVSVNSGFVSTGFQKKRIRMGNFWELCDILPLSASQELTNKIFLKRERKMVTPLFSNITGKSGYSLQNTIWVNSARKSSA